MALYWKTTAGKDSLMWQEWHVGESFPEINSRVVTMQVDGDELAAIVRALDPNHPFDIPGERLVQVATQEIEREGRKLLRNRKRIGYTLAILLGVIAGSIIGSIIFPV